MRSGRVLLTLVELALVAVIGLVVREILRGLDLEAIGRVLLGGAG